LPVGSKEWLLAVIGAVAVSPPAGLSSVARAPDRRRLLEQSLLDSGLAYGTGALDPAVELATGATAGARAFAHFVAGLVRLCTQAGSLAGSHYFTVMPPLPELRGRRGARQDEARWKGELDGVRARRGQLVAILAAVSGEARAAAPLFRDPLGDDALLDKLAGKVAARLSRRYLAEGGPFAGLPLHNGLCAIEVRTCSTLALAAFSRDRISPAAAHLTARAALGWRALLVELLAGLAQAQEKGEASIRGIEQVLRAQRLPAREARALRRALEHPRSLAQLSPELHSEALRKFALEQVMLAALVDRNLDAGEVIFVEQLAQTLGVDAEQLATLEVRVDDFYRQNRDALSALQRAETPEGLPHALTTRLTAAVIDNLDRLVQEIRETGELAELLAKATAGQTLSPIEKSKVREQLIDLAKTIPALAIFAAPGGMLLLPILLKLLPFNLLPSSFVDPPEPVSAERQRRLGGS